MGPSFLCWRALEGICRPLGNAKNAAINRTNICVLCAKYRGKAALLGYKGLIVWGRHYDNLQGRDWRRWQAWRFIHDAPTSLQGRGLMALWWFSSRGKTYIGFSVIGFSVVGFSVNGFSIIQKTIMTYALSLCKIHLLRCLYYFR